jgi:hypothetical protein
MTAKQQEGFMRSQTNRPSSRPNGSVGAAADKQRWADDSGPPRGLLQPPTSSLEMSTKPTWTVRSLRDLNEAIRLEDWPDNPAHVRQATLGAERACRQRIEAEAARLASIARAEKNRFRNPWGKHVKVKSTCGPDADLANEKECK